MDRHNGFKDYSLPLYCFNGGAFKAGIQQGFASKLMLGQYFAASSLLFTIGRMLVPVAIDVRMNWSQHFTFLACSPSSVHFYIS
ncbi:hypothetical protein [Peribacillus sp. ACCC06369]|uniref:hypothetical protein n=1 Tax=Peribacillus sp. ACCC06369 TaxID=3055860 RepID=UPI0025A14282|nr:hypothetical protein [Peribacillus sp. ACCC06369]